MAIYYYFGYTGLYSLVFIPIYVATGLLTGGIVLAEAMNTYSQFIKGLRLEIFVTASITSLTIAMIYLQLKFEETSAYLNMAVESAEIGLWYWDIVNDKRTVNRSFFLFFPAVKKF